MLKTLSITLLPFLLALIIYACNENKATEITFTKEQFSYLKAMEGRWQGIAGTKPFYEMYRMIDDSTMESRYLSDQFDTIGNSPGRITLRAGIISSGDDKMEWRVDKINPQEFSFVPSRGITNSFVWRIQNDSMWTATLKDADGKIVVYDMKRIGE